MSTDLHDELLASRSREHELRIQKVTQLREMGIDPWPSFEPVSHTCAQALEEFPQFQEGAREYTIAGRVMTIREHGKSMFAHLQDRSGRLQLYCKSEIMGDAAFAFLTRFIDHGDIVWVRGVLFTTKTGEVTLKVLELRLLSKCLHPLPDKYHGFVDVEQRYRARYLDILCNAESRARFIERSRIVQRIRSFLQERDFIEVETPMLHPIPGGAAARPFVTHHNAYDIDLYLRIAPELYLKRLVVGGFDRVFEINRNFRNEGVSTRHNPEFTMLEFYQAHGDYRIGMNTTEELISSAVRDVFGTTTVQFGAHLISFEAPFKRLTVHEALIELGGFSAHDLEGAALDQQLKKHNAELHASQTSTGEKLFALFEACVEKTIVQPTFIIGYPIEVSPLAKRDAYNPSLTARFELFVAGMELANGFSELNDPFDQAERFRAQAAQAASGFDEAHRYDQDFIHALEYGLPPTVGVGIGIDRLVMLCTGTSAIKDVILFPTMKPTHIS